MAGRYLVAVETERHSADEVRALLNPGCSSRKRTSAHRVSARCSPAP